MPGAANAQNRAIEFTLLLAIPCLAAFFIIPELIMRALFMRGAFTAADAVAAGRTLAAYAFGLLPFVLIRSTVATFFARGDTATPVKAALIAAAVNIAFKFLLMGPLAQVGLALATSIGAWINLGLVDLVRAPRRPCAHRCALAPIGRQAGGRRAGAGGGACGCARRRLRICSPTGIGCVILPRLPCWPRSPPRVYGGSIVILFGRGWLAAFRANGRS